MRTFPKSIIVVGFVLLGTGDMACNKAPPSVEEVRAAILSAIGDKPELNCMWQQQVAKLSDRSGRWQMAEKDSEADRDSCLDALSRAQVLSRSGIAEFALLGNARFAPTTGGHGVQVEFPCATASLGSIAVVGREGDTARATVELLFGGQLPNTAPIWDAAHGCRGVFSRGTECEVALQKRGDQWRIAAFSGPGCPNR